MSFTVSAGNFLPIVFLSGFNKFLSPTHSVMIMMADDLTSGDHGHDGVRHSMGNVTHPFVTQTFRCVAPYETKDTKNRPFKVAVDEKLDVLIKDPAGR